MSLFDITMDLRHQRKYAFEILDKNEYINVDILKNEIIEAIEDVNFPWIELALRTKLVYTSDYYSPPSHEFNKTDILDFLNSEVHLQFNFPDETPSDMEIQKLNNLITQLDIQKGMVIQDVFLRKEFDWMTFGLKHKFLEKFCKDKLENRDIICWLKQWCWEYLFPNELEQFDKERDTEIATSILQKHSANNGWLNCDIILNEIAKRYPNSKIDEFYITKLNWSTDIQYKYHERTQWALGYRRIKR